jgi:hypothetical protein
LGAGRRRRRDFKEVVSVPNAQKVGGEAGGDAWPTGAFERLGSAQTAAAAGLRPHLPLPDRTPRTPPHTAAPRPTQTSLTWSFSAFSNSQLWVALITFLYLDFLDATGTM